MNSLSLWKHPKLLLFSVKNSRHIYSKLHSQFGCPSFWYWLLRVLVYDYAYWFCFVAPLSSGSWGYRRHRSQLLLLLSPTERIHLCRFRCGNHKLPISVGHYLQWDAPKPCPLCDTGDEGDECHYVLFCHRWKNDWNILKHTTELDPVLQKLICYSMYIVKKLSNLSRFINVIMSKFESLILKQCIV